MKLEIAFTCTHCGHREVMIIVPADLAAAAGAAKPQPSPRTDASPAGGGGSKPSPTPAANGSAKPDLRLVLSAVELAQVCGCGHERGWHDEGKGGCRYGLQAGGARGCSCATFHKKGKSKGAAQPGYVDRPAFLSEPFPEAGPGDKCAAALLCALAEWRDVARRSPRPGAWIAAMTIEELAIFSGYSMTSGGFGRAMRFLRMQSAISDGSPIELRITETPNVLRRTRDGVVGYWAEKLGACPGALLQVFATASGSVTPEELGEATGYKPTSGGFGRAVRLLRKMGLVSDWGASADLRSVLAREAYTSQVT